ncbi:hypothetical protein EV213_102303 [Aureibacillus halotolerans]|uniref:Uncharacterized protein n=1 Tax=Aureibacillus halotolerans TaxID=1508390 RepID=A0A4R6U935_9BACI|nr:hypothetical protein EV213_102303 [Aureibacillus halotolerans]
MQLNVVFAFYTSFHMFVFDFFFALYMLRHGLQKFCFYIYSFQMISSVEGFLALI